MNKNRLIIIIKIININNSNKNKLKNQSIGRVLCKKSIKKKKRIQLMR